MADRSPGIFASLPPVREVVAGTPAALDALLREATTPFVVRGLIAD